MSVQLRVLLFVGFLGAMSAAPAAATALFYSDRATWEAAGGSPVFEESFDGFTTDTLFRDAPVQLSGLTIEQIGTDNFRNYIDTSPYAFTENNGTPHASVYTNADGNPISVELRFDQPNVSLGFDTWVANDQEGAVLEIYDGASLLGALALDNGFPSFLGYVLDGGEAASHAWLVSGTVISGGVGEGFGLDDLAGSPVPEPGTAGLLALGLAGLAARRQVQSGRVGRRFAGLLASGR